MKPILIILITLNCAFLGFGQKTHRRQNVITCKSYDFSRQPPVCNDSQNATWKCGSCTGSITAHGCLLSNSAQQDPDTVDCKLRFTHDSDAEQKYTCMDDLRASYTCLDDVSTYLGNPSCSDCKLA